MGSLLSNSLGDDRAGLVREHTPAAFAAIHVALKGAGWRADRDTVQSAGSAVCGGPWWFLGFPYGKW